MGGVELTGYVLHSLQVTSCEYNINKYNAVPLLLLHDVEAFQPKCNAIAHPPIRPSPHPPIFIIAGKESLAKLSKHVDHQGRVFIM